MFGIRKKRIYADAAASVPVTRSVKRRFNELLELAGNPGGLHREAIGAKEALEDARKEAGAAIRAHADEMVFTSGGTESNNLAIFGALRPFVREGEPVHAITSRIEHPSVLEPLMRLEDEGLAVTYLHVSETGLVSPKELREALRENTVLVSIQMVNSEIGIIEPVAQLAKEVRFARKARTQAQTPSELGEQGESPLPLYFHTDASQAPLWLSVDAPQLGVDLMTLDAQKMGGVRGAGALYVKRGTELEPLISGGGQERGLRSGTENVALAGSFARALRDAQKQWEKTSKRVAPVRDFLIDEIRRLIPEAVLNGPAGKARVANNMNVSISGLDGEMAVIALDSKGISASTRSACGTEDEDPSYVLTAIGADEKRAREAIRITLLPDATYAEASRIVKAIKETVALYRT